MLNKYYLAGLQDKIYTLIIQKSWINKYNLFNYMRYVYEVLIWLSQIKRTIKKIYVLIVN